MFYQRISAIMGIVMNANVFHIAMLFLISVAVPLVFAEDCQNRPTLTELNEAVEQAIECGNAVIERDVVVSRSQSFFPYCGHGQAYFASLQTELEYLSAVYVDHVNGPLTTNQAAFLNFTVATWRDAAGLNTNGFRRAITQDGGFSYGYAQSGDIIGSWIYEDIENGYSALKWTKWANYSYVSREVKSAGGASDYYDCGGARGTQIANWNATDFIAYDGYPYMVTASKAIDRNPDRNCWNAGRVTSKLSLLSLPSIPCVCDAYFQVGNNPVFGTIFDIDGIGAVPGELFLWPDGTGMELTGEATYTTGYLYKIGTNPIETIPLTCPNPPSDSRAFFFEFAPSPLMKWSFTNE